MTRVKVCGLMNEKDINICVEAGVDMLGFVVEYPVPVPWNLSADRAEKLINRVPPSFDTGIVVGGSVNKILKITGEIQPDFVQLHYKETLQEVEELAQKLDFKKIKVIKALRMDSAGNCDFAIKDPVLAIQELEKVGVSEVLIDSYTETRPGGTGIKVDLSVFSYVQRHSLLPVILAGGLSPDNITTIVNKIHPYAVDVLTGVETAPGRKDAEKIKRFTAGCRPTSLIK